MNYNWKLRVRLRTKLTLTLVFISLMTAAVVGSIAYWLLIKDFRHSVMQDAFNHFEEDVQDYLTLYGSWEKAKQEEHFSRFLQRRHSKQVPVFPTDHSQQSQYRTMPPARTVFRRPTVAPLIFMLADTGGRVIKPGADYRVGDQVSPALLETARPIVVGGREAVLAIPVGQPELTPQDLSYIHDMRNSLVLGVVAAAGLALILGLALGQRMSRSISELTRAIRAMRSGGALKQQVHVRSQDEIGELARVFNRMSQELAEAHYELHELSIRDPLTQLYNRRHFTEQARQAYQQAIRYGHPLSVMICDLDNFKRINDAYSHAVGDEVLVQVSRIFHNNLRRSDIVARWGGGEFVVLYPETNLQQAYQRCETLRQRVQSFRWEMLQKGLNVTLSIGLSDNLSLGGVEKMILAADHQLYAAKEAGRNRIKPAMVLASAS